VLVPDVAHLLAVTGMGKIDPARIFIGSMITAAIPSPLTVLE
jgi:hypothetical protein